MRAHVIGCHHDADTVPEPATVIHMAPKREQAPVATPASIASGLLTPETALQCLSQLATAASAFSEVRHRCAC